MRTIVQKNFKLTRLILVVLSFLLLSNGVVGQVTLSGASAGNGSYTTLKAAFDAVNGSVQEKNNVVITITGNTTETATATLNSGNWTTLTIYPTTTRLTISGSIAGPIISLNGATKVTIDGRVNQLGTSISLAVSNTSTSTTAGTSTIRFINGAKDNVIKYCTLSGASDTETGGVVFFSTTSGTFGNATNTINNNGIRNLSSGAKPRNGIYSLGTAGKENSGNIISNNYIYNTLNTAYNSHGIYLSSNSSDWEITGNSFYEMNDVTTTAHVTYYAIRIDNTSGGNFTITNNYIGGKSSQCGGNPLTKTGADNVFYAISLNVGSTNASSIQGNTISNISWANSVNAFFYAINIESGLVNIGTTTGNTIGSANGNGSITYTNSFQDGFLYGIRIASGTTQVSNNTIGSITLSNSDSRYSTNFRGIYKVSTSDFTCTSNTIGSTETENSIYANSQSTNIAQHIFGIYCAGTSSTNLISGNTVANITNGTTNTTPATLGRINGILVASGVNTVSENTVRNLTNANVNSATDVNSSIIGIAANVTDTEQDVIKNTVYNLHNSSSGFQGAVIGIYHNSTSTSNNLSQNFIHSLSVNESSTAATLFGIKIASAVTCDNNIISIRDNTSSTLYGIWVAYAAKIYFNSVVVGGSSTSTTHKSYCIWQNSDWLGVDIRNNIFFNSRSSAGGTNLHYGAYFNFSTTSLTLDYNSYTATGTGGMVGFWNGSNKTTTPIVTGKDANSTTLGPGFANSSGSEALDYLPFTYKVGQGGTGITTDYFGISRTYSNSIGAISHRDYSVGTGQTYTNLYQAFNAVNTGSIGGALRFSIISSTAEPQSPTLYASGAGSASYSRVLVYPATTGMTISINASTSCITVDGASNVTIDGRVNSYGSTPDLKISNNNTSGATILFQNGASNNTVKYCNIEGISTISNQGLVTFSGTSNTSGNSNNVIEYNNISSPTSSRTSRAIISLGDATYPNTNNVIKNNNIYDFLYQYGNSYGIYLGQNSNNFEISGNSFYETTSFAPSGATPWEYCAIMIQNTSGTTINNNFIGGNAASCGGTWTKTNDRSSTFYGIKVIAGIPVETSIQGNTIKNFAWSNSAAHSFYAIYTEGIADIGTSEGNTIGATTGTGSITLTNATTGGGFYGIYVANSPANVSNNTVGSVTVANASTNATNFYGIYRSTGSGDFICSSNKIGSTSTANSINASSASSSNEQYVFAIFSAGSSNNTISSNTILNLRNSTTNTSTTARGRIYGLYLAGTGAYTATDNQIGHLAILNANNSSAFDASAIGIVLNNTAAKQHTISGNMVSYLSNTNSTLTGSVIGLYYNGGITESSVTKNFIRNLTVNESSTAANVYGIKINAGATSYSNNIINLGGNTATNIYGIFENGASGNNNNLYFNTVYIGGTVSSGTNTSYALWSNASTNTRDFRNNIFFNARSTTDGSNLHYAAYFNYAVTSNLTADYNDYWVTGTGGTLGYFASTNKTTPQIVTGSDVNSISFDPLFANAGGVTATSYKTSMPLTGIAIEGYELDYEGVARLSPPSMGAFKGVACANPTSGGTIADAQTVCSGSTPAQLSSTVLPSGHSGALEYKWQLSTTSGTTGFSDIASSDAPTYQPGELTQDTWFRRMARSSCAADWSGAVVSNAVKITVNSASAGGSISGNASITYGASTGTLTLSGHTGTIQKWQKKLGSGDWTDITNTSATHSEIPSSAGSWYYRAEIKSGVCPAVNSSEHTLTVSAKPLSITAENKEKFYGDSDPSFTVSYDGFISGEDETFLSGSLSLTRETGETVGEYSITPSGYTSVNYSISFVNGTLTILANTRTWSGTGNWENTSNWTPAQLPNEFSTVTIDGNLTINSYASAEHLSINPNGSLTITSGNSLNADKVILRTDATRKAASLTNNGTLTVNTVEYQRYIPTTVFEYVSSPVANQTASVFGTLGENSAAGNGLFAFDVNSNAWSAAITNEASPISAMKGFAFIANSNQTVTFSGTGFYSGEQSIGLIKGASTGFNLVGNPYPSAINWDADAGWTRGAAIDPVIWVNTADAPGASTFATFNHETPEASTNWASTVGTDEGVIAPTQAFWVYTTDNVSLAVNSNAQVHSANVVNKKSTSENPLIRLQAQRNGYSDEMVIYFHSEATEGMDRYDTRKKLGSGAYPQLYAPVADAIAAVNTLPQSLLSDKVVVPITLKSDMAGSITIALTELKNLEEDMNIILTDKATGSQTDLRTAAYTVEVESNSTITGRFEVTIERKNVTSSPAIDKSTVNIYASAKNIYVGMAQQGSRVEVYNAIGVQVLSQTLNGGAVESIQTNLPKGVYIVVVNGSEGRTVKRVFIN